MKILFVSAEVTPVIKVGGLADVVGSLPKALQAAGHDVRIVIPKYDQIDGTRFPSSPRWSNLEVPWNGKSLMVHVDEGRLPGTSVPLYFLDCPAMFHPGQILHRLQAVYANSGDPEMLREEIERFIFFSLAIVTTLPAWDWQPTVVHIQDWHTSFIPVAAKVLYPNKFPPTLLTIHNLQNQGRWKADEVWSWLGWAGHEHPLLAQRDRGGNLNLLQLGILGASAVNTVSPTYAKEILTPAVGEGLEDSLRQVSGGVEGVLNGIDELVFNPATDPILPARYDAHTVTVGKTEARKVLADRLNIQFGRSAPLIVSVGRWTEQKGYQLLPPIADWLFSQPLHMILLGTGTSGVEQALQVLAKKHSNLHLSVGFDAKLAQLLYAAGDLFLMPSEFEPCGLGQMIAMRYGTLPVVRATGGLRDTVVDLDQDPDHGTGFVFDDFTPAALRAALNRALDYLQDAPRTLTAQQSAMRQDFSWRRSSQEYENLYAKILSHQK